MVDVWWNIGGQNQWVTKSRCFHDYWWRHRFSWVEMFWTRGTTWAQILLLNEINKIRKCILWIDVVVCKIQAILHACQPFLGIHVHMAPLALDSLSTKTVLELRISFSVYAWYLLSAEESDITNTVCTFKQQQHFWWQPPLVPPTTQETTPIFSRLICGSWWNCYNGNPHQHPMQIRTKLGRLTCGSHDHSGLSININTPRDLNFLSARSTATATWKTARNGHKVKYLFSNSSTRKGWRKYRCELHA